MVVTERGVGISAVEMLVAERDGGGGTVVYGRGVVAGRRRADLLLQCLLLLMVLLGIARLDVRSVLVMERMATDIRSLSLIGHRVLVLLPVHISPIVVLLVVSLLLVIILLGILLLRLRMRMMVVLRTSIIKLRAAIGMLLRYISRALRCATRH